ncbi:unnamed protein product [marine sediment metagenome]|uniref:Uncharacterized protein n=1 Tax=marine sediment metagenome TaxID=412755 RepID=X1BQ38_9ZZZZ
MGEWREVTIYKRGSCPCNGCQVGWGSCSSKIENGKHYTKYDDCTETCQRLKDWELDQDISKHDVLWKELAKV